MKRNTYIIFFGIILLNFSSCTNLEDYKPLYSLPAETAIVGEASANLALTGCYAGFRQRSTGSGLPDIFMFPSLMSGLASNNPGNRSREKIDFAKNEPTPTDVRINLGAYTRMYDLINRTNWLIEKVSALSDRKFSSPTRRKEMIAEAKGLRALAHFYLLRLWGQFYDVNSKYGIDVRLKPARTTKAQPRKTVAQTYAAILKDIADATKDAGVYKESYLINKVFLKGLKAKVLLYKGDYVAAAQVAKTVIDGVGVYKLAETFGEQFDNTSAAAIFDNKEVLFGTKGEPTAGVGMGGFWGFSYKVSKDYVKMATTGTVTIGTQKIKYDKDRVSSQFKYPDSKEEKTICAKYNLGPPSLDKYEMIYHLRLAEVYLIYAEASARATKSVSAEALAALNKVRKRAGATTTGNDGFETYPSSITVSQFLTAVRIEKQMELGAEQSEEWFDLIRYDYADGFGKGFQVKDVKPTATDKDKFILPIGLQTIEAGGKVIVQNPGY